MENLFNPEKKVTGTLVGVDGNAFVLMGHWSHQARAQGWSPEDIKKVMDACQEKDYKHLVSTLATHMTMEEL